MSVYPRGKKFHTIISIFHFDCAVQVIVPLPVLLLCYCYFSARLTFAIGLFAGVGEGASAAGEDDQVDGSIITRHRVSVRSRATASAVAVISPVIFFICPPPSLDEDVLVHARADDAMSGKPGAVQGQCKSNSPAAGRKLVS